MLAQNILNGLNPSQAAAVQDTQGRLLLLASAGSGKTRVLTHRIAYLLEQGIEAWKILSITFTNKAAKEMKARVKKLSGDMAKDLWSGTFHSICLRILTRYGSRIGYDKFTLIDASDQKKLVNEIAKFLGYDDLDYRDMLGAISTWKSNRITPGQAISAAKYQDEKNLAQIYQAYEDKKRELHYMDFDDLLSNTVTLFENAPDVLAKYQSQFHYIFVDEFQDTDTTQFQLIDMLAAMHGNVFLVGDDSQSIYSFRNAKIENILNYQQTYPDTKVYKLEENYRSTQVIVNAANAVVENNIMRLDKTARSMGTLGDPIITFHAEDDSREADFVANMISRITKKEGRPYSDFAVLYRTNRQSRAIEMAFTQFGLPYKITGGSAFYDRKEIKDLVSYMRAIDNGVDDISFERIINVPKRGVGKTTIDRIREYAESCHIPFAKALTHLEDIPKLQKKAKTAIGEFLALMDSFRAYSISPDFTVLGMLKMILSETEFYSQFDLEKEEDESRIENIQELMNVAGQWDEEEKEINTLTQFLTETSLVSDIAEDDDNHIQMMSVHASKGLEFSHVFVVGLEAGIFPHGRSMDNDMDLEEERRLMYVAMTRAEHRLFLSRARQRYEYGQMRAIPTQPSMFFKEVPRQFVYQL